LEDVFFGFGDCFEDFGAYAEVFGQHGFRGVSCMHHGQLVLWRYRRSQVLVEGKRTKPICKKESRVFGEMTIVEDE